MKNTFFNSGMLAVLLTFALTLGSCASMSKPETETSEAESRSDGLANIREDRSSQFLYDAATDIVNSSDGGIDRETFVRKIREQTSYREADYRYTNEDKAGRISWMAFVDRSYGSKWSDQIIEFTQRPGNKAGEYYITRILVCYSNKDYSRPDREKQWGK